MKAFLFQQGLFTIGLMKNLEKGNERKMPKEGLCLEQQNTATKLNGTNKSAGKIGKQTQICGYGTTFRVL